MESLTLTVEETAKLLGISRNTAYSLVAQGTIPSLRLGKRLVIPRMQLERLLAGQQSKEAAK
jgi:excisionase family DNA binding protein